MLLSGVFNCTIFTYSEVNGRGLSRSFTEVEVETNSYYQINQNHDVCIEMDLLQVGSEPVGMRCPHCHEDIMTKAHYVNTTLTHIIALVLGILFWWLCCCIIPYVTKKWRNVEHYCPNCRRFLGIYSRNKIF